MPYRFQNPHYQWDSVFVEFLVFRCHLDVHVHDDIGVKKRGGFF